MLLVPLRCCAQGRHRSVNYKLPNGEYRAVVCGDTAYCGQFVNGSVACNGAFGTGATMPPWHVPVKTISMTSRTWSAAPPQPRPAACPPVSTVLLFHRARRCILHMDDTILCGGVNTLGQASTPGFRVSNYGTGPLSACSACDAPAPQHIDCCCCSLALTTDVGVSCSAARFVEVPGLPAARVRQLHVLSVPGCSDCHLLGQLRRR